MPKLVRLYIINVAIGLCLSLAFVGLLMAFDIKGVRGLILGSSMGWVAFVMLVVVHWVLFAGAQFAIAVMRMAEPEDNTPRGGLRQHAQLIPVKVAVEAKTGPAYKRQIRF